MSDIVNWLYTHMYRICLRNNVFMWATRAQRKRMFHTGFLYGGFCILTRHRRSTSIGRILIMEYPFKEVDFNKYCPKCKYEDLNDIEDPCNECLDYPANEHSDKPVNYILRKERRK